MEVPIPNAANTISYFRDGQEIVDPATIPLFASKVCGSCFSGKRKSNAGHNAGH